MMPQAGMHSNCVSNSARCEAVLVTQDAAGLEMCQVLTALHGRSFPKAGWSAREVVRPDANVDVATLIAAGKRVCAQSAMPFPLPGCLDDASLFLETCSCCVFILGGTRSPSVEDKCFLYCVWRLSESARAETCRCRPERGELRLGLPARLSRRD